MSHSVLLFRVPFPFRCSASNFCVLRCSNSPIIMILNVYTFPSLSAPPSHPTLDSHPTHHCRCCTQKVDNCFTGRLCSRTRSSGVNFGGYCFPLGTRMSTCHFLLPHPCLLPLIAFTSALESLPVLSLFPLRPSFVGFVIHFRSFVFWKIVTTRSSGFSPFSPSSDENERENHRRCLVGINLPARLNVSPFLPLRPSPASLSSPRPSIVRPASLIHHPVPPCPSFRPFY